VHSSSSSTDVVVVRSAATGSASLAGMTTDLAEPPLKLRSPLDIIDAIPYLFGFEPANSMVALSLRGKRSRLGLTARADLPPAEAADASAREYAGYLKRDKALRALVVFYPPSLGLAHPSVRPLADALLRELTRVRIEVKEMLCVSDGRWWSLICDNEACCPSAGTPIPSDRTSVCVAELTMRGAVALESREALERTLDPVGGFANLAMSRALPKARGAAVLDSLERGQVAQIELLELYSAAVDARCAPDGVVAVPLEIDQAARMIAALDDKIVRDEILCWFGGEKGDALRGLLVDVVRHAVPPHHVAPLTTLAWISYLRGDGGFAGIALDRALAADPGYYLGQILDQVLRKPVDPEVFRQGLAHSKRLLSSRVL
jgi:hypothetical protein